MISAAALYPRIPPTSIVPKCTTLCSLSHSSSRTSIRSQTLQSSASTRSLFRRLCFEKNRADELFDEILSFFLVPLYSRKQRFSALPSDIPWHDGDIWSIFAAYFFILHIPLSFGGLSVVAQILHEPDLDPLIMIVSLIALQIAEYVGVSALLYYNAKPQTRLCRFFHGKSLVEGRSWITASAAGIGSLVGLMLLTSIVADWLVGLKDVNNPILKQILSASSLSTTTCFFLYCFIAPLLEETMYRGFLLSSLSSRMKWWQAVIISSLVFSISHFSGENSFQLFLVGCVLGSAYCWTGALVSCFTIHSVYNAIILLVTIMS